MPASVPALIRASIDVNGGCLVAEFDLSGRPPTEGTFIVALRTGTEKPSRHRQARIQYQNGKLVSFHTIDFERQTRLDHDLRHVTRNGKIIRCHLDETLLAHAWGETRVSAFTMLNGRELQYGVPVQRAGDAVA